MMRNLTHKVVYRPKGDSELYDYRNDPRELDNLWNLPQYAALQKAAKPESTTTSPSTM